MQPDSIIPDQFNPQSWNRFSYVTNRPISFNDPTGHLLDEGDDGGCVICDNDDDPTPPLLPLGGGGGCGGPGQPSCGGDGDNGDNNPDKELDVDKPLYAICIAGGTSNPGLDANDNETGTGQICHGLSNDGDVADFEVIGNTRRNWLDFLEEHETLTVDYNFVIVGYSMGGRAAMELVIYLDGKGIDVPYLFLVDPVDTSRSETLGTVPDNVGLAYLLLENGEEPTSFFDTGDWATHGNDEMGGLDRVYYIFNSHHGNIDENSAHFIPALIP